MTDATDRRPTFSFSLLLFLLAFSLAAASLAFLVRPAGPAHAQVEVTEVDPPDGARLDAPPQVVHMCFSQNVVVDDSTKFNFQYIMPDGMPDGRALGLRIVFTPSGECVDVFPGLPHERPAGLYTFEWRVTAAEGEDEGSGALQFRVTKSTSVTPSPTRAALPTATAAVDGGDANGGVGDDNGGSDVTLIIVIVLASVGGVAVLLALGFLLRRRIGPGAD